MEQVLDLYAKPQDEHEPLICMDEASKELHAHVSAPLPLSPGRPPREDDKYQRHGTRAICIDASATPRRSIMNCGPGTSSETIRDPKFSGNSPPPTRESSYAICTHNFRVAGALRCFSGRFGWLGQQLELQSFHALRLRIQDRVANCVVLKGSSLLWDS